MVKKKREVYKLESPRYWYRWLLSNAWDLKGDRRRRHCGAVAKVCLSIGELAMTGGNYRVSVSRTNLKLLRFAIGQRQKSPPAWWQLNAYYYYYYYASLSCGLGVFRPLPLFLFFFGTRLLFQQSPWLRPKFQGVGMYRSWIMDDRFGVFWDVRSSRGHGLAMLRRHGMPGSLARASHKLTVVNLGKRREKRAGGRTNFKRNCFLLFSM